MLSKKLVQLLKQNLKIDKNISEIEDILYVRILICYVMHKFCLNLMSLYTIISL